MTVKKVFLSYHHDLDHFRADKIRAMHQLDKKIQFSEAVWEEVQEKPDAEIEKWINTQLENSSCLVVLIGQETAKRK